MPEIRKQVAVALQAVNSKKAEDVSVLQLPRESSTFTDYFLICSGSNPRQVQAIADEVDERLSKGMGVEPNNREGYQAAEWILLDYVDFVVHIFNAQRRAYYDLERLWKSANKLTEEDLLRPEPKEAAPKPARRAAKPAKKAVKKKAPSVRAAAKGTRKSAAKKTSARKPAAKKSAAKKVSAKAKPGAKKKTR